MTAAAANPSPLLTEVRDGALWITFTRPHRLNAATPEMEDRLVAALDSVTEHGSGIRAVVFTGASGKKAAFMAGNDTDTFGEIATEDDVRALEQKSARTLAKIENLPVPTVAAMDGAVIGEGALIAACCDVLLCGPHTKFGFPIARTVGNCLTSENLRRLVRLLGDRCVRTMLMRARLLDGAQLAAVGATLDVADSAEELAALTESTVATMTGLAPLTLQATKESLRRDARTDQLADNWDLVVQCYLSQDSREALAAFAEKRTPRWVGR